MINTGCAKIVLPDNYIGLCCLLLTFVMSAPVVADLVLPDLDGDSVPDAVDADQDNDGLLNIEEGLVQIQHHELPESVQYMLMPDGMVPDDHGLQAGYALQNEDDVLELHAEIIRPVVRTLLQQSANLPKVQLVNEGRSIVEWTIRRGNNAVPMNIDFLLSDLDAERMESVSVEHVSIAGYSLSPDSSVEVQNLPGDKLLFIARGAANEPESVLLHVRNRDALRIEYHSSAPQRSDAGVRAGFLHSFDSAYAGTYTMVAGEKDTDVDGQPDHRDIDSDGDDIPDVVEAGFVQDIEEAMEAPVNEQGVPMFETDIEDTVDSVTAVTTDQDGDGLKDHQEWYLGTDKTIFDTDADGFGDGEEVSVYHTDPTDAASSPMGPSETIDEPNNNDVDTVANDVTQAGAAMQDDATTDAGGESPLTTGVKGVGCVMGYGGRDSTLLLILALILLCGWVRCGKRVSC